MKTLNLKSMSYIMVVAMMFIGLFTSCSGDDDTTKTETEFPNLQETNCNPDGTVEISFEPTAEWQLASNKSWCKFVNGDFKESTMTGKAGKQTITAKVSDDGQNYSDDEVAEITLTVEGKSQVIYKITRPKKIFNGLTIKDEEGNIFNAENPILIKGSGFGSFNIVYTTIIAESEFVVGVSENPDWIAIEAKGEGKYSLVFNNDNKEKLDAKYSFTTEKGYNIIFGVQTEKDGIINVAIPVAYEGLKEDAISFNPSYIGTLSVSVDGKTFTEKAGGIGSSSTESTIYNNELKSTITVRDDKYHVLKISQEEIKYTGVSYYTFNFNEEVSWIKVTEDGANLTLTSEAIDSKSRAAIVMVFPENIWNNIKDDLQNKLIDKETLDEENGIYRETLKIEYNNYALVTLTQEPEKITLSTFKATASNTTLQPLSADVMDGDPSGDTTIENTWTIGFMAWGNFSNVGDKIYLQLEGVNSIDEIVTIAGTYHDSNVSILKEKIGNNIYVVFSYTSSCDGIDMIIKVGDRATFYVMSY